MPKSLDANILDEINISREDAIAFSEYRQEVYLFWRQRSTWLNDQVTPAHLIVAATRLNESIEVSFNRFQKFIPLGLEVPNMNLTLLQMLIDDKNNLRAFSKRLEEQPDSSHDILHGNIHPTRIILAALTLSESIHDNLERFRRFAPALDLNLPDGEPEDWQFCTMDD